MSDIGHNLPLAETYKEVANDTLARYLARRDALVESAAKAFVTDNDSTGRAGDTIKLIAALRNQIEAAIVEVRDPIDTTRAAIIAAEDRFLAPLNAAEERIKGLIEEFRKAERIRIKAQRDEQAAAEATARAKAAARRAAENPLGIGEAPRATAPADLSPAADDLVMTSDEPVVLPSVRGDYGSLTRDQTRAEFEITDVRALPDEVLLAPAVKKAMLSAIRALHRLKPEIPGVTVSGGVSSQTRK